jgi:hypothetical protein
MGSTCCCEPGQIPFSLKMAVFEIFRILWEQIPQFSFGIPQTVLRNRPDPLVAVVHPHPKIALNHDQDRSPWSEARGAQ